MASDCGEGTSAVASSTMDSAPVASASVAPVEGGDKPRLKLEELKWDHSFVRELPGDPRTDRMPREVFFFSLFISSLSSFCYILDKLSVPPACKVLSLLL